MASFLTPKAVVTGFKERVESLTVQGMSSHTPFSVRGLDRKSVGDRLYLGTATGSLYIYGIDESFGVSCCWFVRGEIH
jgi:Vam6/Vps39-like protein vacuolar protein sorting-associated protein 39